MERRGFRLGRGLALRGSALGLAVLLVLLLSTSSDGFRMPSLKVFGGRAAAKGASYGWACRGCCRCRHVWGWLNKCCCAIAHHPRPLLPVRGPALPVHARTLTRVIDILTTPHSDSVAKEAPVRTVLFSEAEGGSSTGPAKVGPLNVTVVRMCCLILHV